MPEVVIRYEKPETLKVLKLLGKYLDFTVVSNKKGATINGVTILPPEPGTNAAELRDGLFGKNLNTAEPEKKTRSRNKSS